MEKLSDDLSEEYVMIQCYTDTHIHAHFFAKCIRLFLKYKSNQRQKHSEIYYFKIIIQ